MVEVKNGEFLQVKELAFKRNDNSVFFDKREEKHYDCFDKKVNCNYRFYKFLGKPKSERRSWDNNEEVYTYFNITKSPAFNYTYFDYETGEALQIRLLEAKQPKSNNTRLDFEIIFSDVKDEKHIIKDYESIPSFNGTQAKRISYYKECFDKFCEEYVEKFLREKTFKVFEVLILKIAYKELFPYGKIKHSWPDNFSNELVALRVFDVLCNFNLLKNDKYFSLFQCYENDYAYNYVNFFKLKAKYKNKLENIFKILTSSNSGKSLVSLYLNSRSDKLPDFYNQVETFIKENKL